MAFGYATKKKGGKSRKRGKNSSEGPKRDLILKEEGQEYARVLKMLGNGRLEAECFDEKQTKKLCTIRGTMRKKVWVNVHDIILVSIRDYQDDKGDVIHKYSPEEARELAKAGEIKDVQDSTDLAFQDDDEEETQINFDEV